MKRALIIALGVTFPLLALAGTPEEDPIVGYLRETFSKSRTPTVGELKIGHTWGCRYFVTTADTFGNEGRRFLFQRYDGLISEEYGDMRLNTYGFFQTGFMARAYAGARVIRITAEGDLIAEESWRPTSVSFTPSVIFSSKYAAAGYSICPSAAVQ